MSAGPAAIDAQSAVQGEVLLIAFDRHDIDRFWFVSMHVDDIAAEMDRLTAHGATVFDPVTPRGEGWWSASVADPFGNLIGLIQSPHWAAQHGD